LNVNFVNYIERVIYLLSVLLTNIAKRKNMGAPPIEDKVCAN